MKNVSAIINNFFRFNIYIIIAITIILLILIQPYNIICRSTQKCNPIMLNALMPTDIGQKDLVINFTKPKKNQNFNIFLAKNTITKKTGTKIKNEIYIENISQKDQDIIFSYKIIDISDKFIEKLNCPCLSKRTIKAGETQTINMHFFIKKIFEEESNNQEITIEITIDFNYTNSNL